MISPKKKKSKKLLEKLNDNYRLNVLKEVTYEEKFTTSFSIMKLILFGIILVFIFGILFWSLFAYTGLKHHIPGYPTAEFLSEELETEELIDSLGEAAAVNQLYYQNLRTILSGEIVKEINFDSLKRVIEPTTLDYEITPADSAARVQINQENQFDIEKPSSKQRFLEQELLFKPTEGVISDGIDFKKGHFGIDISAPADTRVKAILPGTVIFSGFSAGGGNEIHLQHDYNLISIYKHNSAVLKKPGEIVTAGESIAIVGNTGEHSDGTHLHFEMWRKGVPLDPIEFFSF